MRKYILKHVVTVMLAFTLCLASCGGSQKENIVKNLDAAEVEVFRDHSFEWPLEMCDKLVSGRDSTLLTWREYCRMAVIYAFAYDHDYDTDASMASATLCLSRAEKLNADSTKVYLNGLDAEYAGSLNTVTQALRGLNTDHSLFADHEEGEYMFDQENDSTLSVSESV